MKIKSLLLIALLVVLLLHSDLTLAQCAMCKANAESSLREGNNTAKGINAGIMYLILIPYIMVAAIGYWWYTRNKKNKTIE